VAAAAARFEKWMVDARKRERCRSWVCADAIGVFAHIVRATKVQ
jgi:hypothetical protein